MTFSHHLRGVAASVLTATALTLIAVHQTNAADSSKVIKLAVDLPFSGSSGPTEEGAYRAFDLAVGEANASLPGGYHIEVVRFDHGVPGKEYSLDLARQNARDNVADPKILAVYGTYNSAAAEAEIPILNEAGLAMVSSMNSHPGITKGEEALTYRKAHPNLITYFRTGGTDDLQGPAGAELMNQLGLKTVYVLDNNDAYGKGIADLFEVAFKAAGGNVLGHDQTQINDRDYSAEIDKIKALKPQAIYFGANGDELGAFRAQMGKAGMQDVALLCGDAMGETVYIKTAGQYAPGSYYTAISPDAQHLDNPMATHFLHAYSKKYHMQPGPFDVGGYATGLLEAAAVKRTILDNNGAAPTRAQVLKAIANIHVPTLVGTISFDENGDTKAPYIVFYGIDKNLQPQFIKQFIFRRS
jgi:branched-chain amino acid transport system substrate-binding protein